MKLLRLTLLVVPFLLALAVYWPGLGGPFLFDDYYNLEPLGYGSGVHDLSTAQKFVFGNGSGPSGRPVSMATFLLNDAGWPSNPWSFKNTNLLLHCLAGLFVYLIISNLAQLELKLGERPSFFVAFVTTSFFLLHPINVSTVLYVVQRMAILSAIFVLAGFYLYLRARQKKLTGARPVMLFGLSFLVMVLGFFSKENAVLLLVFVLIAELFWFRTSTFELFETLKEKKYILGFSGCGLLVLVLTFDVWGGGYAARDFDLHERLFYQVSALGDYLIKLIFPQVESFNLFNGFHENADNVELSGYFLVRALIFLGALALLVYGLIHKKNALSFGLLWFFVFHLVESSVLPLELYFEHRNYLPGVGVYFAIAVGCYYAFSQLSSFRAMSFLTLAPVLLYLAVCTLFLSVTWSSPASLFLKWEMDEPDSARAKVIYASYLEQIGFPENSIEHIDRAISIDPDGIGLHLNKVYLVCSADKNKDVGTSILDLERASDFKYGVVGGVEKLIKLEADQNNTNCFDRKVGFSVSDIFKIIENGQSSSHWPPRRAARYFSLKSDYYASQRDLSRAVNSLEKAIEHQPSVDLNLKAAVMLASAGLYMESLEKLEAAKLADQKRKTFVPSRMDELNALEMRIRSLMGGGYNNG